MKIKEFRVSGNTNPKQLATSIIYALEEGYSTKCIAIGNAISIMTKGVCLANMIYNKKVVVEPFLEYIKTKDDIIKNTVVLLISIANN